MFRVVRLDVLWTGRRHWRGGLSRSSGPRWWALTSIRQGRNAQRPRPPMRNVSHVKLHGSMAIGGGVPGHAWSGSSIKANAPESSGVYAIYSAVWIYIGESNDIQHRLLEHWNGDNACIMRADASGFMFEVCDPAERVRRQT